MEHQQTVSLKYNDKKGLKKEKKNQSKVPGQTSDWVGSFSNSNDISKENICGSNSNVDPCHTSASNLSAGKTVHMHAGANTNAKSNEEGKESEHKNHVFDVVIVGAGWAGLAAARQLLSKNIRNFLIIEGRDYIGGRSRTITLNDDATPAELGSQWIHGANAENPAYQALLESGVKHRISDPQPEVVYSSHYLQSHSDTATNSASCCSSSSLSRGEIESHVASAPKAIPDEEIERILEEFYHGPRGFLNFQESFQKLSVVDRTLRNILNKYYTVEKLTSREILVVEWILDTLVVQEYAADLHDLSSQWWDNDAEIDGSECHIAQEVGGGYSGLIEQYYAAPFTDQIRLNCKVTSVNYSAAPNVVKMLQSGKDQTVIEKEIKAKDVIMTVPLGILKAGTINFVPALPKRKKEAIENLGYGLYNKVIMLWDEDDNERLPWPKDKEWIENIESKGNQGRWTEFFSTSPLTGRPLLYAFTAGAFAKQVETMSDEKVKNDCLDVLRNIYGVNKVPEPKQVIVTRWGLDEFSYGSYSYHKVNSTPKGRKILRAPLKRRLYFAGEATSRKQFATVQGAIISGIVAANSVAVKTAPPLP